LGGTERSIEGRGKRKITLSKTNGDGKNIKGRVLFPVNAHFEMGTLRDGLATPSLST
jgi:hypothetical protein